MTVSGVISYLILTGGAIAFAASSMFILRAIKLI